MKTTDVIIDPSVFLLLARAIAHTNKEAFIVFETDSKGQLLQVVVTKEVESVSLPLVQDLWDPRR